jgi:ribosome-associated protein
MTAAKEANLPTTPSQEERLQAVVDALQEKKALDIVSLDLRRLTDTTDHFVLCSATTGQHVRSLTDEVTQRLRNIGERPWHIEGYEARRWVLVDCVDIVVHILQQDARQFYSLERLWGDAPKTTYASSWDTSLASAETPDGHSVFARS